MAGLVAAFDWSTTPLGVRAHWPRSLKTLVDVMLAATQPMFMAWGPQRTWFYNDAFRPIIGRKHPAALGQPIDAVWAEAWDALRPMIDRVFAGEPVRMSDFVVGLDRDGQMADAHFDFSYTPARNDDDVVEGLFGVCIETTERVLAEQRAAAEQARQRRLLNQMPGFMAVLLGPEHVFDYVNDAYVSITGRSDFVGRKIREALPELEGQGFYELLDDVYATGETLVTRGMELRLQGVDEVQFVDFAYEPIRGDAGEIVGIFVGGYEVTEAYRVAAALRASEARLRELNADLERRVIERTQAQGRNWRLSPDLMGALNSEGYFETSNPAWGTVLGWSEDEVASMSIFELLHPDDVERTRHGFELTQQGQPAIRFPNRYRCKDGSYRWISWVGIPEEGMVYCTGRDITLEKAAEEELAATQEALRQSQKMEAVGQLTGGLAHDFNNLLAGISGNLELLETRMGQGRMAGIERYIGAAQGAAKRAAALTQRLLAFSRRQTLDPRPTDVNRLIAGIEELIRRTVGPAVTVEVVGAGGLWATRIDPSQLENALLNLCINGRDAMAPDGGRLTIETANKWLDDRAARERELPPGQYISLCVTDTGTGMTPEVIARAFDPFFTTKPIGEGTGLGLSMIHGFVRQSGGQVRIYSEFGKGTTMCLYLPRHAGGLDDSDVAPTVAGLDPGDGETVLVIDDEALVRGLIVEVLEENGYRALEAGDGPSGLRILQSDLRIDLLITDVGLPGGMNGRQVADAARVARPGLKVLFITGYAENAAVGNGHLDAGMEIVTKPFVMATLGAKIRDLIDR
jgi:PAS domain S-box-containing protein